MSGTDTIIVRTAGLPAVELERLIKSQQSRFPDVMVSSDKTAAHRGLLTDPAFVSAVVTGVSTIFAAFIPALVERFFSEEPKAAVTIERADGAELILDSSLPEAERARIIDSALASGMPREIAVVMPGT